MPGVNYYDGSSFQEVATVQDGQGKQRKVYRRDGSQWVRIWPERPTSTVSRESDDSTFDSPQRLGLRFETSQSWPEFGAEISGSTSGFTTAYIYRISDNTQLVSKDISSLTGGDTFTLDVSLSANTTYSIQLDNPGGSWTSGYYENAPFPYTSTDGNLSIVNGASIDSSSPDAHAIRRIGNVGFS